MKPYFNMAVAMSILLMLFVTQLGQADSGPFAGRKPKANPTFSQQARISSFVYSTVPWKGKAYADRTAFLICDAAAKNKIDPYWVAATAKVESSFTMGIGKQVGIMQFTRSTGRMMLKRFGYNVRNYEGNIRAGAKYLALNYHQRSTMASRGSYDRSKSHSTSRMAVASARYNRGPGGASTSSGRNYARKVMKVRNIIMNHKQGSTKKK